VAAARRGALERARELLARNRAESLAFVQAAGARRTRELLEATQADLEARLRGAEGLRGPGRESFTAVQVRATLRQVRAVLSDLKRDMRRVVVDHGQQAAEMGAEHTAEYLVAADRAFRGVGEQPLALRTARMLEAGKEGVRASILMRLASDPEHPARLGILDRYGVEAIGHFERELQRGILGKKSWAQMRADITERSPFLKQAPAHWAQRIVRTESMNALNRGQWEATREAHEQLGDMVKILSATFDDRTAADSYVVHGQIRRPEEAFETWYGFFAHPPARPNDREIVVPHRIRWPIPAYLAWRDGAEVAARWAADGNKRRMPPRPLMTTVPLSDFGK
jgi:hypothetical protein